MTTMYVQSVSNCVKVCVCMCVWPSLWRAVAFFLRVRTGRGCLWNPWSFSSVLDIWHSICELSRKNNKRLSNDKVWGSFFSIQETNVTMAMTSVEQNPLKTPVPLPLTTSPIWSAGSSIKQLSQCFKDTGHFLPSYSLELLQKAWGATAVSGATTSGADSSLRFLCGSPLAFFPALSRPSSLSLFIPQDKSSFPCQSRSCQAFKILRAWTPYILIPNTLSSSDTRTRSLSHLAIEKNCQSHVNKTYITRKDK